MGDAADGRQCGVVGRRMQWPQSRLPTTWQWREHEEAQRHLHEDGMGMEWRWAWRWAEHPQELQRRFPAGSFYWSTGNDWP